MGAILCRLTANPTWPIIVGTMAKDKKSRLFLSLIALVAIVLLAAGLSEIRLGPGQPFPLALVLPDRDPMGTLPGGEAVYVFVRVILALALLCSPFLIVYFIISAKFRKRVLKSLISLLWIYVLYVVLTRLSPDLLNRDGAASPALFQPQDTAPGPAIAFTANPPPWFTLVAAFGLAALLAALFVGGAWFGWRHYQRPLNANPLQQLAQEARDALESLQAGADLKDVVLRCYFEMIQVLNEQRGIERRSDMTPREFEYHLEGVGLPGEHVRRLTRLFEAVRYGAKTVGEDEQRQAIACLTAIVEFCGEAA